MASTFEELNEKLAKAVEENTKAQTKATEMTGEHGKAIRRLTRDTAQQRKRAAFLERDLKGELDDALFAPFAALGKLIPKPLKILGSMPVQAAMRGAGGGGAAAAPRVDASGTPMGPGNGVFKGAMGEAWGREISQSGIYTGTKAHVKGMLGMVDKSPQVKLLEELKDIAKTHTKILERIEESLSPKR
ncbi:uncharacterized protein METZ01_LOCUS373895, partial [marine metagenome]